MIIMRCSNPLCRRVMELPDHARGKKVQCKACGSISKVPSSRPKVAPPSDAPSPPPAPPADE